VGTRQIYDYHALAQLRRLSRRPTHYGSRYDWRVDPGATPVPVLTSTELASGLQLRFEKKEEKACRALLTVSNPDQTTHFSLRVSQSQREERQRESEAERRQEMVTLANNR
jgi:hypothetical protein